MKKMMIKVSCFTLLLFVLQFCFSQEDVQEQPQVQAQQAQVQSQQEQAKEQGQAKEDALGQEQAKEKAVKSETEKKIETLNYGLEADTLSLISSLIKDKDASLSEEVLKLFNNTRNAKYREKILEYFVAIKDLRLKDYCLELLQDPYEERSSTIQAVLNYVTELEIKEACPHVVEILKNDNTNIDSYYSNLLNAIGKLGGKEEADYLIECLKDDTIPLAREQAVMKALGDLRVVETYDYLIEVASDEDKNSYVRNYALEAASKMGNPGIIPILVSQFSSTDPSIRCCVVRSVENFIGTSEECKSILSDALKDNHQNVRLEAVKVCRKCRPEYLTDFLIYRSKNDNNVNVKYECFYAIAALNNSKGTEYLNEVIADKMQGETNRAKAFDAIFEYEVSGCYGKAKEVAFESLGDDKLKNLRYSIGKTLAKHKIPEFTDVCQKFLENKDVATQGIGLDIYLKNDYSNLAHIVDEISKNDDKKTNANARKAKLVLEKVRIQKTASEGQSDAKPAAESQTSSQSAGTQSSQGGGQAGEDQSAGGQSGQTESPSQAQ